MMAENNKRSEQLIFAEEALVVNAQGLLQELMNEKGVSRADLARAMGVSRARVTQLFSDECTNFTLRLWARALFALGEDAVVTYARSEDCLNHYLGYEADFPATEGFEQVGEWHELQSIDLTFGVLSANDNVFSGLLEIRDANAIYGVAA
jgi:transcriptional regulator with XRE-family HTH domain